MKFCIFVSFLLIISQLHGQVLIHAHNDYEKPEPLFNAIREKAFAIEADVYLVNGQLAVAHDRKDIDTTRTLTSLYLNAIDSMMRANKGFVTSDKKYQPVLVVDIKADGEKVLAELVKLTKKYPRIFDQGTNPNPLYLLVSGDRGPIAKWKNYPASVRFDGRPSEVYDAAALNKLVTISESYGKYYRDNRLQTDSLSAMISRAHSQRKLVRLWGSPDFPATWRTFQKLGIDIINTDKVAECRQVLSIKE
ncbi:MAG: glycerophosphodiester phosphodiesterase [Chitinophagaceae bacterium]|nr:MAG: glycerophosphodiester phosphodiesterase [Chitinophagaceae bacterium]